MEGGVRERRLGYGGMEIAILRILFGQPSIKPFFRVFNLGPIIHFGS